MPTLYINFLNNNNTSLIKLIKFMLVVKKKVLLYLSRTTNATTTVSTHTRRCEKKNIKYAHLCMRDNGDGGTFVSRAAFLQRQELTY